jgi:putative transposase
MTSRGERGIWQRPYWEHTIRDQRDFDYIHFNPIKHSLVGHPNGLALLEVRRCVASGMYQSDWQALLTNRLAPASDHDRRRPHP